MGEYSQNYDKNIAIFIVMEITEVIDEEAMLAMIDLNTKDIIMSVTEGIIIVN